MYNNFKLCSKANNAKYYIKKNIDKDIGENNDKDIGDNNDKDIGDNIYKDIWENIDKDIDENINKNIWGNIDKDKDKDKQYSIHKDVEKINSLTLLGEIINLNSPLYNSFINNRSIFFYLIDNYKYNLEHFINYLIEIDKFIIFDNKFYNKFNKLNINISQLNLSIYNSSILNNKFSCKFLLNMIIKMNDTSLIKSFLKEIVFNYNIEICKEIIQRLPFFLKTKLDYDYCYTILTILEYNTTIFYDFNSQVNFKQQDFKKFKILELLFPFIIYNIEKESVGNITSKLLNSIIIKHNATDFLKLYEKYNVPLNYDFIDNYGYSILADCLKYGITKSLYFLLERVLIINQNTDFLLTNSWENNICLIDCSFNNYNYKISEIFLNKLSSKIINSEGTICITNFINKYRIKIYIKTIFNTYEKKKINKNTYYKYNKIIKSSLKKHLSILYKFLNNETHYKEINIEFKKILIKEFIENCILNIIKSNISIEFFKQYITWELNLDLNKLLKYENIYKNKYNLYFLLENFNTNIFNNLFNNTFLKYAPLSFCKCKITNILEILNKKKIVLKCSNKLFNIEINKIIINFLENCYKCTICKNDNYLDFIIDLMKKYYLKDNCFIADSSMFISYKLQYITNSLQNTNYSIEQLFKVYFLNGFTFIGLFEKQYNIPYFTKKLDYKYIIKLLKNDNTKSFMKQLFSYAIINYNIKKYIQNKKLNILQNFKTNISKINNEFMFSPIENNDKINKFVGIEFKKHINTIFTKNPVHITPHHCVKPLYLTHKYITEKADGISKKESLKNISDINIDLIVEYEKINNINIVYNINNSDNILENIIYLRSIHPYTPNYNTFNFNDKNLEEFKVLEKEAYDKYIIENIDKSKLWWPKFVWILEEDNKIDYLKKIDKLKPLNIFKTDGYILYSNETSQDIIKIKPFDLITIDLKYVKNNWYTKENKLFNASITSNEDIIESCIYRIYYDKTTKIYYPKEQRNDKKYPNNNEIVEYLVNCHKSQWTIKNIIDNLENNIYYQLNKPYNGSYLKNIIKKYSFENYNYINGHVLDFGCGYKQTYLKKCKINSLYGVDSDINVVLNKNENNNINNINYGLYDFSLDNHEQINKFGAIYNFIKPSKYTKFDTIIMLNTIHNCFPYNSNELISNINHFSNKNCNIIIRYLDRDLFNNIFNQEYIDLNNFGFIKKNNKDFINIFFNWCHNKQHLEYIVSKKDLIELFSNCEIIYEEKKDINYNLPNIEKYFNCFKTIIFRK